MKFFLERSGVGEIVRPRLKAACQHAPQSTIYWISYNAHYQPDLSSVLKTIKRYKCELRILLRHPNHAQGSECIITRATLKTFRDAGVEVRGLLSDRRGSDADDSDPDDARAYGKTHAKMIVAESPNGDPVLALMGSFNASNASLTTACETIVAFDVHAQSEAAGTKDMLREAKTLWDCATSIEPSDCNDSESISPGTLVTDGPASTGSRALPREALPEDPRVWAARPFGPLLKLLEMRLRNFQGDWQWRAYRKLHESDVLHDILYLPVGCGKTFIALYWLIRKVSDHGKGKVGLYLTPNRWVQTTVTKRLDDLYAQLPRECARACRERILVCRPSTQWSDEPRIAAVVADEVHNWSPHYKSGRRTYTGFLDALREGDPIPILGLSATPCRMEHNRFCVSGFVDAWLGSDGAADADGRAKPLSTVVEMTKLGVIAPLKFVPIGGPDADEAIRELVDKPEIAMGDYSKVVLRRVWEALAGNQRKADTLVNEISKKIEEHNAMRVVVFLPPVGSDAYDRFLTVLAKKLRRSNRAIFVGDFIAREGDSPPIDIFADFSAGKRDDGLRVLFTVDRFSEGVSVDDVDMLVMLRATLSPRVAVQQLGRGIRTHAGKKHCVVLDAVRFEARWQDWESSRVRRDDSASPARVARGDRPRQFERAIARADRKNAVDRRVTAAAISRLAPEIRLLLSEELGWTEGTFNRYLSSDFDRITKKLRGDDDLRIRVLRAIREQDDEDEAGDDADDDGVDGTDGGAGVALFERELTKHDRRHAAGRRLTAPAIRRLSPEVRAALSYELGWEPGTLNTYLSTEFDRITKKLRDDDDLRVRVLRAIDESDVDGDGDGEPDEEAEPDIDPEECMRRFKRRISSQDRYDAEGRRVTEQRIHLLPQEIRAEVSDKLGWKLGTFNNYLSTSFERITAELRGEDDLRVRVLRAISESSDE